MSQIEDRIETVLDETKQVKLRTGWGLRLFIGLLVLAVAVGLSFYTLKPARYTSTAYIQILSEKPHFLFDEPQRASYNTYVGTQFALIRSPLVLSKAAENPDVTVVPYFQKQADKINWLNKNLKLRRTNDSEIVELLFTAPAPEVAQRILDTIVSTYFDYYVSQNQDWNLTMLTQLNLELNRQKATARMLQEEIRVGKEKAAQKTGISAQTSEVILQNIYLNESKLDALRAELKMLQEAAETEIKIPQSMLNNAIINDPMLRALFQRQAGLEGQLTTLKKTLERVDDPSIEQQIKEIGTKIEDALPTVRNDKMKEIQQNYKEKREETVVEKQIAVRTQEVLVDSLRQKHKELIANSGVRDLTIIDTPFQEDRLRWVNTILDQLESRIAVIDMERNSPNRVELKLKASLPIKAD